MSRVGSQAQVLLHGMVEINVFWLCNGLINHYLLLSSTWSWVYIQAVVF